MIIGIGVDTVDLQRFTQQIEKTPKLSERLFTEQERLLSINSLAARFAAKEALIKAFGGSDDLGWQDMEVTSARGEKPRFVRTPALLSKLSKYEARDPLLSLTHDGNIATAFVILESLN